MHLLITGHCHCVQAVQAGSSLVVEAVQCCSAESCNVASGPVRWRPAAAAGPQFEGTKKPRRLSSPHLTAHNQISVSPRDNVGEIHAGGPQFDQSALTLCHCQWSDVWECGVAAG